jgi:uncharacterized protein (DUF4415 family)
MSKEADVQAGLKAEAETLAAMPEEAIDLTDMPEVADWSKAERGRFYRPVKQQLTLRLDADVVHWFKSHAPEGGYQTGINQALRRHVDDQERRAEVDRRARRRG